LVIAPLMPAPPELVNQDEYPVSLISGDFNFNSSLV